MSTKLLWQINRQSFCHGILYFLNTQNVILTVVCVFPERDIFKGYNTDWMVAILKWGVCKENLCLSLEELTVKRHSYLGGFVPSHIELQEMVLKYTHFFCRESWWVNLYFSCFVCRERTLWFPITSLNSTVMDRALFPCMAWQALVFRRGIVGKSPGWCWGWSVSLGLQTMASY